ncbi:ribonuclease H-like domain-containing protein [Tanacetum coccineum]
MVNTHPNQQSTIHITPITPAHSLPATLSHSTEAQHINSTPVLTPNDLAPAHLSTTNTAHHQSLLLDLFNEQATLEATVPTNALNPNPVSTHPMVTRSQTLVPRPPDINIVRCMWLFRHKYLADGTLRHYKARLVVNVSTQIEGVDVDETFSPVVKPSTIRTVLSLATSRHWPIHQLDVKNAFLHGDLSDMVYMHQPSGFQDHDHPDYVCLLQRQGTDTAYLLLYVDDIVLTASFEGLLQRIIRSLHQEFAMTDLGPLNYFLAIYVTRDSSGLFLSQKKYVVEILERAYMVTCNPCRIPIDTESKLGCDGAPVSDPTLYQSLAGSLQYLTFTRPDISYAVQQGMLNYGLQLFSSSTMDLVAYSDAEWAGCPTTRCSTSEYRGVANAVAETCWLRNLLHLVAAGHVRVLHVPFRYQFADIFTKGLPSALFEEFRSSLSV